MPRGDSVEVGVGGVGAVTQAQGIARRAFKVRMGRAWTSLAPPGARRCGWHREDHRPTAVVLFVSAGEPRRAQEVK